MECSEFEFKNEKNGSDHNVTFRGALGNKVEIFECLGSVVRGNREIGEDIASRIRDIWMDIVTKSGDKCVV